jgi:hypothetical protein
LLLPVSAPWCKIAEVIDFARTVKPRLAVPIHDAILSEFGLALVDRLLGDQGPGISATYRRLAAAESIELWGLRQSPRRSSSDPAPATALIEL